MIDAIHSSLQFQSEALKLRATRQQLLASNIVNADTPNFKAQDFDFARALEKATAQGPSSASRTAYADIRLTPRSAIAGVDGNTVNMDSERTQFVDNALRYEAALRFLNGKIRTLLSAIQG